MKHRNDEPYHITIEVENKQCKILKMLKTSGIDQFKVIDIRSAAKGLTSHLVQMPTKHINKIPSNSFKTQKGTKTKDETSGWINSTGCEVCSTILSNDSFLISGRSLGGYNISYSFIARNYEAFQNIISKMEKNGLKPKILEVRKYQPKQKVLTETQERVLWLAYKMGFFAYPRKINTLELSQRLKIKPATLSEITRRGIRRLLEYHFET
jgi:predicted DNA binding protein